MNFTGEVSRTLLTMAICVLTIGGAGSAARAAEQALMADRAVDIMGVDTHVWSGNWGSSIESDIRYGKPALRADMPGGEAAGRPLWYRTRRSPRERNRVGR